MNPETPRQSGDWHEPGTLSQPDADIAAEDNLVDAVRDVLATMFFTDVMHDESAAACDPGSTAQVAVAVRFEGETSGEFRLRMPEDTATSLAANFLGISCTDTPGRDRVEEVALELGNMMCGAFLSRQHSDQLFAISPPESVEDCEHEQPGSVRRHLALDSGELSVSITWRDPG